MAKTSKGKERHEVEFRPETWRNLQEFMRTNGFGSVDEAVSAFLQSWMRLKELLARAEEDSRVAAEARAEAERLRDQAARRVADLDQREAKLRAEEQAFLGGYSLSHRVVALLGFLLDRGIEGPEVLKIAELVRASGLDYERLIEEFKRLGGARPYVAQLVHHTEVLEEEKRRLQEHVSALRRVLQELEARKADLEQQLATAQEELNEVRAFSRRVAAMAAEAGVYIETFLRGTRADALPELTARVIAGSILMAAKEVHGDRQLWLEPNPAQGRYVRLPVLLSEVPDLLAPRQMYEEMRRQQARLSALGEVLAEQAAREATG